MTSFKDERFEVPQTDIEGDFDSTDLHECLEYFEEFGDIEPLRSAIAYNDRRYREVKEHLKTYIDECGQMTNGIVKSRFTKILNILRK